MRSQTMSVRAISNFRALLTFLLANAMEAKPETLVQLKQVLEDISQDSQQFFTYVMKLVGHFQQNNSFQQHTQSLQSLRAEVDAVFSDN